MDASGNTYVAGSTASINIPTTAGAYQTVFGGSDDAFVARLSGLDPPQILPSECLFDWAQKTYASLFALASAISNTFGPYYFRHCP